MQQSSTSPLPCREEVGEFLRAYVVIEGLHETVPKATANPNAISNVVANGLNESFDPSALVVIEQEIKDYILARLSKYKALTRGVRFVDEIPMSASGKILRAMLREMARQEEMIEEAGMQSPRGQEELVGDNATPIVNGDDRLVLILEKAQEL